MPTDPLTASRYPSLNSAVNVPQDIQNAVFDLADNTIPRFATVAARDTAYNNWISAGGGLADGMLCHTDDAGGGLFMRRNGSWTLISSNAGAGLQSGTLTPLAGYTALAAYSNSYHLSADGRVTLSGIFERSGASFSAAAGEVNYFCSLPAAIRPSRSIQIISFVATGATPTVSPCRIHTTSGNTQLALITMSTGTLEQNKGYVSVEGVTYTL